ncbi:MAG: hypothetical protein P8L37_09105, partial [Phycisphaerales bacterium]|nr:hypothetical protein [Phycisphaerales bacterium]
MATVSLCTVWLLPHVSTARGSELAADAGQDRGVIQDSFVLPIIPDIQQYVWNTKWKNGIWYTEWPLLCNLEDANGDLITDSQLYSLHHLHSMITHISNMDPPPPYVHHVGDIVEDHHEDVLGDCEWEISDCLMRKLENAGIPWGMSVGNHESCFQSRNNISGSGGKPWCEYIYDSHSNNLEDLMMEFDEFFPRSRWKSMPGVSTGSYDSANLDDSPSMMFSWHSFNAGNGFVDNKWLVVNIGWFECDDNDGPSYANCIDAIGRVFVPGDEDYLNTDYYYPITDDVYARLNQLIKSHADHSVIIGQHRLIQHNQWTPQGYLTYHNLVKDNPNVKLMLCGHHIETEHQHIVEHIAGEDGVLRQVHVIMINYQNINGGGDGYFHETTITDRGGGADFRTYSPSLGQYADPAEYPNSSFDISFGPVGDVNRDGLVDSID